MKNTLFISHATPADNSFAIWLATKLELYGYKVWVDANDLDPSVDFWNTIESTIRNDAIKFIFVASNTSIYQTGDGVKKELAVADRIRRQDSEFVVPVRIDGVDFNDFPVELVRLNAIDFNGDWGNGLSKLLKYLGDQSIEKPNTTNDSQYMVDRWQKSQSSFRSLITDDEDRYFGNLFPIELPPYVYIYKRTDELEGALKQRHIPHKTIKEIVVSFACDKCIGEWLGSSVENERLETQKVLGELAAPSYHLGQQVVNLSRDVISLINWSLGELFYQHKLRRYKTDSEKKSRSVYYFPYGLKARRSTNSRAKQLSGKYKNTRRWHYGLSAYYSKYPMNGVIVKWHLVFADSTGTMLPNASQIAARRSKGKLMFNKEWKELLQAAMFYLADGAENIFHTACCEENAMYLASKAVELVSEKSYVEPSVYKNEVTNDE